MVKMKIMTNAQRGKLENIAQYAYDVMSDLHWKIGWQLICQCHRVDLVLIKINNKRNLS